MGQKITLDKSRWPLIVTEYPEKYSARDLRAYFDDVRELLKGTRRYVMLLDLRAGMSQDSESRDESAAFMRETADGSRKLCVASVFVVSNKIMKLALQGVFALQRPVVPTHIVDNREDGEKLALKLAADAGLAGARASPSA